MNKTDEEILRMYQCSPIPFIADMWGLQPLNEGEDFVRGKHISPQQLEVLLGIESELISDRSIESWMIRISVVSGHGVGKSSLLSWIILWFLFSFYHSQVACTAPTAAQMHDVLWKELAFWLKKMPAGVSSLYDYSATHIRMKESPDSWFARARTASKENTEALAGVHADYVLIIADEASGVPNPVFETAEGALTGKHSMVILCSNGTRSVGYFFDTHHSDKSNWLNFSFNSEDSLLVESGYSGRIAAKYGQDSDEYRIRVLGMFPREDAVDISGYVPLLNDSDLRYSVFDEFVGERRLGVDPAGEGRNTTAWVVRDHFRAVVVAQEDKSTPKSIAQKTMTIMEKYNIPPNLVYVDIFGVGAKTVQELAISGAYVQGVNVGEKPDDATRHSNLRAEVYFRLREWVKSGGELFKDKRWEELLHIRFRHNERGRIQIMSKELMVRRGYVSPDIADALSLTFVDEENKGGVYGKDDSSYSFLDHFDPLEPL